MSEPFLGQLALFSFNFPPRGWAFCNGQLLQINQNQALFSLLGTFYGGNGQTTFALPDLRSRTPIHLGSQFVMGQAGGQESHTLLVTEMPTHIHPLNAHSGTATSGALATPAAGNSLAQAFAVQPGGVMAPVSRFSNAAPSATLNPAAISSSGGSQPHENRQPFLAINFCIALTGIFPSRN